MTGCQGLYQYGLASWSQVEAGAASGRRVISIVLPIHDGRVTEPLLVLSRADYPPAYQAFSIEYTAAGRYRLLYEATPWNYVLGHRDLATSSWLQAPENRKITIDLTITAPNQAPPGGGVESAVVDGYTFAPGIFTSPASVVTVGSYPVGSLPGGGPRFTGTLAEEPVPTPLCHETLAAIGTRPAQASSEGR